MPYLVNKVLLDLLDKYHGDLGLLDERWATEKDRKAFSSEQIRTLGEYVDKLHFVKTPRLSQEFKMRIESRIQELEKHIDPTVISVLRQRMDSSNG